MKLVFSAFYGPLFALTVISGCQRGSSSGVDTSKCPRPAMLRAKAPAAVQAKNIASNLMMPEPAASSQAESPSSTMPAGSDSAGNAGSNAAQQPLPEDNSATGSVSGPSLISIDDMTTATVAITFKLTNTDMTVASGICTGVIAGRNYVLTAAHCFAPPSERPVGEFSGRVIVAPQISYTTRGSVLFDIERVAVHPDWNGVHHDIAVVFIKSNFPANLKAVSIAKQTSETAKNTKVLLVGYGITGEEKTDAGTSRHGESSVHSLINKTNYPNTTIENQIRIKGSPQTSAGACTGDSGGPAFLKNSGLLLGLVSGMNLAIQENLDCKNRDSNYTLVEPYLGWIESVTGQKNAGGETFTSLKELAPAKITSTAVSPVGMSIKPTKPANQTMPAPKKMSDDAQAEQDPCAKR
ncbi:MAG: S1 family peptidase [Proteobacteria bacterium]|nr:S1 family peptidase [Pseudomonadota bacterium]